MFSPPADRRYKRCHSALASASREINDGEDDGIDKRPPHGRHMPVRSAPPRPSTAATSSWRAAASASASSSTRPSLPPPPPLPPHAPRFGIDNGAPRLRSASTEQRRGVEASSRHHHESILEDREDCPPSARDLIRAAESRFVVPSSPALRPPPSSSRTTRPPIMPKPNFKQLADYKPSYISSSSSTASTSSASSSSALPAKPFLPLKMPSRTAVDARESTGSDVGLGSSIMERKHSTTSVRDLARRFEFRVRPDAAGDDSTAPHDQPFCLTLRRPSTESLHSVGNDSSGGELAMNVNDDEWDAHPADIDMEAGSSPLSSHPERVVSSEQRHINGSACSASAGCSSIEVGSIPADVGKLRYSDKSELPFVHLRGGNNNHSMVSSSSGSTDRNSVLTVSSAMGTVGATGGAHLSQCNPEYNTGDEQRDKRLCRLHRAADEIRSVEEAFVRYLRLMIEEYPVKLVSYVTKSGRPLLAQATPPDRTQALAAASNNSVDGSAPGVHVVHVIQSLLLPYYEFHKVILSDIEEIMKNWTSLEPNMSQVFHKKAGYFKACVAFLKDKQRLYDQLDRLLKDNPEFADATQQFEAESFNVGIRNVLRELDQVHQNVLRYKLLMSHYKEYLEVGTDEHALAQQVLDELEQVNQHVNAQMGLPSSETLLKLHERFQFAFDVYRQGRRLIKEETVEKQTRKEKSVRVLVLFSDTLWLCREAAALGSSGQFDMTRSYEIPISSIRVDAPDHSDYDKYLEIHSKEKSVGIWFRTPESRREWKQLLEEAKANDEQIRSRLQMKAHKEGSGKRSPSSSLVLDHSDRRASTYSARSSISLDETNGSHHGGDFASSSSDPMSFETPRSRGHSTVGSDVKPIWIPDSSATECLMVECQKTFNFARRRHHCRNCGLLICRDCSGFAPMPRAGFARDRCCAECYRDIMKEYEAGTLFPSEILHQIDGVFFVEVKYMKRGKERTERVNPACMFEPPTNMHFTRIGYVGDRLREGALVFSRVYWRNEKGDESERYALLSDIELKVFRARQDKRPLEVKLIYGYRLTTEEPDGSDGMIFTLQHMNQVKSERAEDVIVFRVASNSAAQMWSEAFNKLLPDLSE